MKERIKQLIRYYHLKKLFEKYERVLMPATLVVGVIADWVTFTTIDITTSFILLGVYVVLAGLTIVYLNAFDANYIPKQFAVLRYLRLASPFLLQFTFGALLSGSFIFYFFSGTLFVSWPFILLFAILMVSNEVFRHYYLRPVVQVGVYFFVLFSLLSILLPFVFHSLGVLLFIASGILAVVLIVGFVHLLSRFMPHVAHERRRIGLAVAIIYSSIHIFYFLNIIPPIPLSIRDAALAHDLRRVAGGYSLAVEKESWWQRLLPGQVFHKNNGERVFVYTAIFAPKNLQTKIVHHWQQYDEKLGQWVTRDRLAFQITGGAKIGYRGYSVKTNVPPGKWRVDVETDRGQVLGRVRFRIALSGHNELETITK